MSKLFIKWSELTNKQKSQVESFYGKDTKDRKFILNKMNYQINTSTGEFMNNYENRFRE